MSKHTGDDIYLPSELGSVSGFRVSDVGCRASDFRFGQCCALVFFFFIITLKPTRGTTGGDEQAHGRRRVFVQAQLDLPLSLITYPLHSLVCVLVEGEGLVTCCLSLSLLSLASLSGDGECSCKRWGHTLKGFRDFYLKAKP